MYDPKNNVYEFLQNSLESPYIIDFKTSLSYMAARQVKSLWRRRSERKVGEWAVT